MTTPAFVASAEAKFIAGLSDRQLSRVVDEDLVPASLLVLEGPHRLYTPLAVALAKFYFDTEDALVASTRKSIVEALAERVCKYSRALVRLGPTAPNFDWKVLVCESIEVNVAPYVTAVWLKTKEVEDAQARVTSNPNIMGGLPCFVGTRVPIDIVLGSLDEGMSIEELRGSYPFVTDAHVRAARVYAAVHPRRGRPRRRADSPRARRPRETLVRPASK